MKRGLLVVCLSLFACGPAGAQDRDWPSERAPRPLAARDVNFPPYEMRTLPNGLQVVAVLHHEQPAVSMRLLVRTGSASDPKGKYGLAHLVASLLDQGTTTRTAQQLNDEIDFIGGSMGAGAGSDLTFITSVVMKDSFETGMRLASAMAREPVFAQEEIERQKQQAVSGLQVSLDDPEWVANAVFDRLVYGYHPYGMPDVGTPESLARISRADLIAFHKAYFVPNNAILAVVGDVTADEAFSMATKVFGDWPSHDVPTDTFARPPEPTRRVIVVNKPDAVQTEIRVGHIGITRTQKDYMALNLATRILGGEGSNRLHQVLRTDRGLTYGAQAEMDTLRDAGDFEAQTNTRSEATGEVVRLIVDEFWRIQRERVSERELGDAKAYLTGSFPLTIETPQAIATQVLNVLFYGLPVQELQTFRERVNAVSVDDIERVARFYYKPDRLSVVLVGNAAAFASQLRGIGFNQFETVDIADLDLTSADFRKPHSPRGKTTGGRADDGLTPVVRLASYQEPPRRAPVNSSEDVAAETLLGKVIAAKGGLETLRGVKAIKAVTASSMLVPNAPGGRLEARTTTYLSYPTRVRVETTLAQGSQVQVFDGEHAWVTDPGGVHEVPDAGIREMRASLQRDTISALLAASRGDLRPRLLPDSKDEDGQVRHAFELSSPTFEPMVIYVDPATNLITKQTYVAGGAGQPLIEERFSDYRMIDGVAVAFAAEVRRGGQLLIERHLSTIEINPQLDPALFTRPRS